MKSTELNEKVSDKILKLLELSRRGIGGEADAAKLALDRLLKKYGVTLEEFIEDEPEQKVYTYKHIYERTILIWLIAHNFGTKCSEWESAYWIPQRREFRVNLKNADYINIKQEFDFYKKQYQKELKKVLSCFNTAFVHKHHLFNKDPVEKDTKPMTMEEFTRITNMVRGFEDVSFHKQIEDSQEQIEEISK